MNARPTLSPRDYERHASHVAGLLNTLANADHSRVPAVARKNLQNGIQQLARLADDLDIAAALVRAQIDEDNRALAAEKREDRRAEDAREVAHMLGGAL